MLISTFTSIDNIRNYLDTSPSIIALSVLFSEARNNHVAKLSILKGISSGSGIPAVHPILTTFEAWKEQR